MEIIMKYDVVIPCHPKDIENLRQTVKSLKHLANKRKIYIISPTAIYLGEDLEYFNIEDKSFDKLFTIEMIKERWQKECSHFAYRASWIYQQLIKLYVFKVITDLTENFIFLDSDTMILQSLDFDTKKFQYSIPAENHIPYKDNYKKMTGFHAQNFSFISHHMMFKKEYLNELISHVENLHQKTFVEVLLDSIDYTIQSPFAEQEIYGNWMYEKHKDICEYRQLKSIDIAYIPNDEQLKQLGMFFNFASSHAWIRGIEAR